MESCRRGVKNCTARTNWAADRVKQAIIDLLKPLANRVRTLIAHNGKEFAYHDIFAQVLWVYYRRKMRV